jgi:hypothetical protein
MASGTGDMGEQTEIDRSLHWGLNPGPSVYKTDALPLSYRGTWHEGEAEHGDRPRGGEDELAASRGRGVSQAEQSNKKGSDTQSPYRLVVRTSRCGRDNPGSTPGEGICARR